MGEEITHFITFDALDQRKRYAEEEIEIFLFLGRELMKAQRMERLDDILHDFKNPALATAGFARRLKNMLEQGDLKKNDPTARKYVEILLEETSRLQEMALTLYQRGEQQVINLTAGPEESLRDQQGGDQGAHEAEHRAQRRPLRGVRSWCAATPSTWKGSWTTS